MALVSSVTLPDAIAKRVPLGGDGLAAPHSLYLVDQTVTGDASGGAVTQTFVMDQRYCTLVRFIAMAIGNTNADAQYRINFNVNPNGTSPRLGITGTLVGVASTVSAEGCGGYWVPPQTICPPSNSISVSFTNILSDTFRVTMEILLWDIRVRELTPWPYLMNAAGGGGQASPGI